MKHCIVLISAFCLVAARTKFKKDISNSHAIPSEDTSNAKQLSKAIIAIEIVDPNENKTSSKNSKRTIESSLGYGYQNSIPKYEVYKYSQNDIPAYNGPPKYNSFRDNKIHIQKSVSYRLPTIIEQEKTPQTPAVKPGTTLFSVINHRGQVGGLSSQLPQPQHVSSHGNNPVPVIILRVYPNQLNDASLFPHLPQSHPLASKINSIDVRSLLLKYLNNLVQQQQQAQQPEQPQKLYQQTQETYQRYQSNEYLPPTYSGGQEYQAQNYPAEHNYQAPVAVQYQQQPYQSAHEYQQSSQNDQTDVQHYYKPEEHDYKHPPTPQQYYQYQEPQYQEQYKGPQYLPEQYQKESNDPEARPYSSSGLLTHENYPSEKHTRVLFRTQKGGIKEATVEPESHVQTKTIKIHVPADVAKVELQETDVPQQYTQPEYQQQYQPQHQPADQNYYYYEPESTQEANYREQDIYKNVQVQSVYQQPNQDAEYEDPKTVKVYSRRRVKNKKRNSVRYPTSTQEYQDVN